MGKKNQNLNLRKKKFSLLLKREVCRRFCLENATFSNKLNCFSSNSKEKESWSSVGGFGMETSNFALNRCLRVSIDRFFDARLNHGLRISLRTLWALWFTKNVFFDDFLMKFLWFIDVFRQNTVFSDQCASIWVRQSTRLEKSDF